MLAYFPHYVFMANTILAHCLQNQHLDENAVVLTVGGGPLPELLGLTETFYDLKHAPASVHLYNFDICVDWGRAINVVESIARENNPIPLTVNCFATDLSQRLERSSLTQNAGIVMLQNSCNELASSPWYQANLAVLLDAVAPGGTLVLADLISYSNSVDAIRVLEGTLYADPRFEVIHGFDAAAIECRSPFFAPTDVRDDFFDGVNRPDPITGQWPDGQFERSKLKFSYTAARRIG
jgi:hypothetical protein